MSQPSRTTQTALRVAAIALAEAATSYAADRRRGHSSARLMSAFYKAVDTYEDARAALLLDLGPDPV